MPSVTRRMIDALYTRGSAWNPEIDGGLDLLLDAKADNLDAIYEFLKSLAHIRNPLLTPILRDLEIEYGFPDNSLVLSETERRQRLAGKVFQGKSTASKDDLQTAFDNAGFLLQVHENSPAVDPDLFLLNFNTASCGTLTSCCGNAQAVCSEIGGEWVVTGEVINQTPAYLAECGGGTAVCGNSEAVCGYFESYHQDVIEYFTPPSTGWPFVFFVGGNATRDGTGALTAIDQGFVPLTRKAELKTLIIKIKGLHAWCGLVVTFT